MKKTISIILTICMMLSLIMVVEAKTIRKQTSNQIIVLEDGYYIEIELNDRSGLARANVSGSKTYTYYNDADEALWKATVTGSFTYDGRYASCTSSSCNVTVYDSTWYTISKTAWTDENFAKASVEMGRKVLGVTVNRTTYNLSLLCDRYGNLS